MTDKNYKAIREAWYQLTAEFEPENANAEVVNRVEEIVDMLDDLLCQYEFDDLKDEFEVLVPAR